MPDENLCDHCNSLDFGTIRYIPWSGTPEDYTPLSHGKPERSVKDAIEKASSCFLCKQAAQLFVDLRDSDARPATDDPAAFAYRIEHPSKHYAWAEPEDPAGVFGALLRLNIEISCRTTPTLFAERIFLKCGPAIPHVDAFCRDASLVEWEMTGTQAFDGRIRPLVANTRLFRKWKESCSERHGGKCQRAVSMSRPGALRFIDVVDRCIAEVSSDCSYVVLSYVWGSVATCVLTKYTAATYAQPGSLSRDLVPATIEDAMAVTAALGERYLWVDRLCIEQDNEADKAIFIPQMAALYGCAEVTIIAAATIDAHGGLPGIRPLTRRVQQDPISLNGTTFMASLENFTGLFSNSTRDKSVRGTSNYNTRGWCFQERLLSARSLIFSEEQVYWECQTASWCEEAFWESGTSRSLYRHYMTDYGPMYRLPWKPTPPGLEILYRHLAETYSGRVLSFQTDELNAFQGILHLLTEGFREEFFWALPTTYLEEALKWGAAAPRTQTRNRGTHTQIGPSGGVQQTPFPSWSWIGWIGNNYISAYGSAWTGAHSLVFYCLNNDGRVEKIGKEAVQRGTPEHHSPERAEPMPMRERRVGRGKQGKSDLPSFYDTARTVITEDHIPSHILGSPLASVVLCFWTSTAAVTAQSDWNGRVRFAQGSHSVSVREEASPITYEPNTTQSQELILCCRSLTTNSIFCLVCSVANGIAYREHVVQVQESHWQGLQTVWKPVILG
ncbi:hypothetical protein MMC26_002087 [Xylographa opegraphella]|nr:hypothetical protein [Xylographa opegraphella]